MRMEISWMSALVRLMIWLAPKPSLPRQAIGLHEDSPERVATNGLASYSRTIKEELGEEVEHEGRSCVANPIKQSHRWIKHRYYSTLGFGEFDAMQKSCRAVDKVSNFLRPRSRMAEFVCLRDRREQVVRGVKGLEALFQTA